MCYKEKIGLIWWAITMVVGYFLQSWSHGTLTDPNLWPDDGHGACYFYGMAIVFVTALFVASISHDVAID